MNSPHNARPNLAALWDRYAANAAAPRSPEWSSRLGRWPIYAAATGDIGWIQVTWTSARGNHIPDTIEALNWAVNTRPGHLRRHRHCGPRTGHRLARAACARRHRHCRLAQTPGRGAGARN